MSKMVDYDSMFGESEAEKRAKRLHEEELEREHREQQASMYSGSSKIEEFRKRPKRREGFFFRAQMGPYDDEKYRGRVGYRGDAYNDAQYIRFFVEWFPAMLMALLGMALCKVLGLAGVCYPFGALIGALAGVFIKYNAFDGEPAGVALKKSVPVWITLLIGAVITAVIVQRNL